MCEPDIARGESINAREALAILDLLAARAQKQGDYGLHSDLQYVAALIESQEATIHLAERAAENLSSITDEIDRKARAAIESLSKLP